MAYSIKTVTKGHVNKDGLTKIFLQIIYNRMRVYVPTIIQSPVDDQGNLKKHSLQKKYDAIIAEQKNEIETRLLDALRRNKSLSKKQFEEVVKGRVADTSTIERYIEVMQEENKGRLSKNTIAHYSVLADKIERFEPGAKLSDISVKWLQRFENWLRQQPGREEYSKMDGNTVKSKMTKMKAICNYARQAGLIEEKQYLDYKVPKYTQKLPEYLTEEEMAKLFDLLQVIDRPGHKLAGYYFLLSCYAGYRISDLKRFNYDEMVKGDTIVLKARKNKTIVSIGIHTRLQKVLDYIKDKPLHLSEPKVREYVKELAVNIGISRKIKFHTSRHSFAMMLAENGFSLDDAAELLGDSLGVAKIYFRISNTRLKSEVMNRLG